ncbi:probable tubulin polyglutamylase ttll-15 isoform X2 [Lytechinus variegatus]|nr:probable tubulin polyglutamylase ttll-15 isoform X2 [Lytechinus variegatus]XP_041469070.1 probable tubulin polyglutamylase ttll-15 isoform X2 [Lytechinus variegatus]
MYHSPSKVRTKKRGLPPHVLYVLASALCLGLLVIMWNVYQLKMMQEAHFNGHGPYPGAQAQVAEASAGSVDSYRRPVVWIHAKHVNSGYLKHVMAVFERAGYIRGDAQSSWDVLWAHDYPFKELAAVMASLKPYQKVNHFPGTGFITNKVYLATSDIAYIPKAFQMPGQRDAFLVETKQNPDTLWVQKSSSHRGIKVKSIADLDLYAANTFIQQYISKPYLIDGKKFDLGFYVTLTSVDPLRVYVLHDEMLVRFCAKEYNPIDFGDVNKYVVGDDYTPVWKMPSLQKYYQEYNYNFMETMNGYWRSKGEDPDKIYSQIYEAIRGVFVSKYPQLLSAIQRHENKHVFFELMRFDFVLDEELNVFLMEVNMSPNLSSAHFTENTHLYERVVYNVLSVNGVARNVPSSLKNSDSRERGMQVSTKEILVKPDLCSSEKCYTCEKEECRICYKCLSPPQRLMLQDAFLEHNNRQSMRRVYPVAVTQDQAKFYDITSDRSLHENDQIMREWFIAKCAQDLSFCQ